MKGNPWWDLPRVETWLKERVLTWAAPLKQQTPCTPIKRYCHVSVYGAKGTRPQMEDYFCTYTHWGNFFASDNTSSEIPMVEGDEREFEDACRKPGLSAEDQVRIENERRRNTTRFLAVFDGHGGMDCAAYARDVLPQEIIESTHFPQDMEQACISSFKNTNKAFISRACQAECDAGTTALVTFTHDNKLYIASVGDCAAVIARKGEEGVCLTSRHTADDKNEAAAVEQRGGTIRNLGGNLRVDGVVSVTRGLGCKPCTAHTSCIPEVSVHDLTDKDEFLLLASDGLWDVMNAQEAAATVRRMREELKSIPPSSDGSVRHEELANRLSAEAIKLGSTDNVTVVIAMFDN